MIPSRVASPAFGRRGAAIVENPMSSALDRPEPCRALGREPARLRLGKGYTVACLQGLVWLTVDSPCRHEALPDLVLAAGQHFQASRSMTVYVSALRHRPARIALIPYGRDAAPAAVGAWNTGSTSAASSSSMSACGRSVPVRLSAT